ncbi:MAG TPA: glycosyltransferase family 4 protein, partial [Verrucomicrobiae bacterium]|nr:glycosyltransferase family 4 protein [Verrucomicrobiae bacterium]
PYLDVYGGGERVCHNVIKALVAHGQIVELLTFDFEADKYREIVGEEFPKSVVIRSLGKRIEVEPPFTIYKRRRQFIKLLKKHRGSLEYDYLFSTQSSAPFEPVFLNKAKKNIAYVHFPEIHFDYDRARMRRKVYLWLFKKWVEQGIRKLDVVFCNSNYTREMIERYWKPYGVKDPIVIYPPVNLDNFWCDKPLSERRKRVIYVARFIPMKRHEIMKKLAADLPSYEFVSVGGLIEGEKGWFNKFSENLTKNYSLKTNLPGPDLVEMLQDSRIYAHLMEGEHFGIAPIEGLASGCITLVHNSGGMKEFIPEEFRWEKYEDLKEKILRFMESAQQSADWERKRKELWSKITVLNPETFQNSIWSHIQTLIS